MQSTAVVCMKIEVMEVEERLTRMGHGRLRDTSAD